MSYQKDKASIERYLAKQDTIVIRVPKESGLKEAIAERAREQGLSVQAFVTRAVLAAMSEK